MKRVFHRHGGKRFKLKMQQNTGRVGRVFYLKGRTLERNSPTGLPNRASRIIALCLAAVFMGGILFTAWPRLYLPSMDFIFESIGLSTDSRVQRVRPALQTACHPDFSG